MTRCSLLLASSWRLNKPSQQELEARRKTVVVALFDTIHNDVVRLIDENEQTEQFKKRVALIYGTDEATEDGAKYLASSCCYISSVLMLLCMCPHTAVYVSSYRHERGD